MSVVGASRSGTPACTALHAKLGCALVACLWLPACGETGFESNCPDVPLYDVRSDAGLDPDTVAARQEAADRGCVTLEGDAALLPPQEEEEEELE
jgi:hypothetical protein